MGVSQDDPTPPRQNLPLEPPPRSLAIRLWPVGERGAEHLRGTVDELVAGERRRLGAFDTLGALLALLDRVLRPGATNASSRHPPDEDVTP